MGRAPRDVGSEWSHVSHQAGGRHFSSQSVGWNLGDKGSASPSLNHVLSWCSIERGKAGAHTLNLTGARMLLAGLLSVSRMSAFNLISWWRSTHLSSCCSRLLPPTFHHHLGNMGDVYLSNVRKRGKNAHKYLFSAWGCWNCCKINVKSQSKQTFHQLLMMMMNTC